MNGARDVGRTDAARRRFERRPSHYRPDGMKRPNSQTGPVNRLGPWSRASNKRTRSPKQIRPFIELSKTTAADRPSRLSPGQGLARTLR